MKTTAVIMAGGRGERFWPQSRIELPKQFISLTTDKKTMIQLTCERLKDVVEQQDIYVVTNARYKALVNEQLPWLPQENILLEPVSKNTGPCIGLAAMVIAKRYKNAVMIVLPSDHTINQIQIYKDVLQKCISIASERNDILTIGIAPTYPETGYGYIQYQKDNRSKNIADVYSVVRFVEKPDFEQAKNYIANGDYLWNSGMFISCAQSMLAHFKKYLPHIYEHLVAIGEFVDNDAFISVLNTHFQQMESVSIDYGILERSEDILTMPASIGWDDVGSWTALERIQKTNEFGNVIMGDVVTVNSRNDIIKGSDRLIAVVGVENTIIVDTNDVLLICSKNETGNIRKIMDMLRNRNRSDIL